MSLSYPKLLRCELRAPRGTPPGPVSSVLLQSSPAGPAGPAGPPAGPAAAATRRLIYSRGFRNEARRRIKTLFATVISNDNRRNLLLLFDEVE